MSVYSNMQYEHFRVKGNKGWRKRWVVFTGQSLRYYTNSKVRYMYNDYDNITLMCHYNDYIAEISMNVM